MSGFIFDVLAEYERVRSLCKPAFDMAENLDPTRPDVFTEMQRYNDVCSWIEENVGSASVRSAGRAIGQRIYDTIVKTAKLQKPTPLVVMEALQWATSTMIRDPKGRGWEIAEQSANSLLMRRTQTFNCVLQEGLLMSLLERTGVLMPAVAHASCTRQGAPYCVYRLTWLPRKG
ncbi:MAG TPA: hypothetical protein VI299_09125 [Polyangiales bacterium]